MQASFRLLASGNVRQAEAVLRKWAVPEGKTGNGGMFDSKALCLQQYCYLISGHIWMRTDYTVNHQSICFQHLLLFYSLN